MPNMNVRDGGSWKAVVKAWVKDAGTWKQATAAHVRDGGTWKSFLTSFSFGIDQTFANKTCTSFGGSCTASAVCTTTTIGGVAPVTYQWSYVSGDVFTIESPTSANSNIKKTNAVSGDPSFQGVYKCVATDDDLNSLEDTVTVTLVFIDLGSGPVIL